jgi:hypothetical protein
MPDKGSCMMANSDVTWLLHFGAKELHFGAKELHYRYSAT